MIFVIYTWNISIFQDPMLSKLVSFRSCVLSFKSLTVYVSVLNMNKFRYKGYYI